MLGTLYIVATPIGNLEDVTLRATAILSDVDIILAEDTRVTKKLLEKVINQTAKLVKLISYHQHSSENKKLQILKLLLEGKNIALVTDAGTPGISDPGNELIDYLLEKEPNIRIIPIPEASSVSVALSVSGFRAGKYLFLGYFPKKKKGKIIKIIKEVKMSAVLFESPHRILKTLEYLKEELGESRRILVARELTKLHETLYRGSIKEVIEKLSGQVIKGEVVVVIEH